MTFSDLYFRKRELSGCRVRNGLHRITSVDKNSSETIIVNHGRCDVTQVSAEAIEINYMGRFKICF